MNFVAPLVSQRFVVAPPGNGRGAQPELPAESPGSCGSCRHPAAGATGRPLALEGVGDVMAVEFGGASFSQ